MSNYPLEIDSSITLPVAQDKVTGVNASVVNRLRDAIIAVQTELGVKPSATYGTVTERFSDLEIRLDDLISDMSSINISDLTAPSQTQGDVIYFNGTAWTRLAAGTSGQFLKTNGAGSNPSWGTASGGGGGGAVPLSDLQNLSGSNGDTMYWNGTNWVRLPIGGTSQYLGINSVSGIPEWRAYSEIFNPSGDLGGSTTVQRVVGISGVTGTPSTANIHCANLTWDLALVGGGAPTLGQADVVNDFSTGAAFTINGQNATGATSVGGEIVLNSGTGSSTVNNGHILFKIGSSTKIDVTPTLGIKLYANLIWDSTVTTATISQSSTSSTTAQSLSITAQASTVNSGTSGNLILQTSGPSGQNDNIAGSVIVRGGTVTGGTGNTAGPIYIAGGASISGADASAADVNINGGTSQSVSAGIANGGNVNITGGDSTAFGGSVVIGAATGASEGSIFFYTGRSISSGGNPGGGSMQARIDTDGLLLTSTTADEYVVTDPSTGKLISTPSLNIAKLSIASQAQGDIAYYNGTAWTRLAANTSGKVLTTNGVGTNPSWNAPPGSSMSTTNGIGFSTNIGNLGSPPSTPGTFTTLATISYPVLNSGSSLLIYWSVSGNVPNVGTVFVHIEVDGTSILPEHASSGNIGYNVALSGAVKAPVATGTRTVTLMIRSDAASGYTINQSQGNGYGLLVQEVPT